MCTSDQRTAAINSPQRSAKSPLYRRDAPLNHWGHRHKPDVPVSLYHAFYTVSTIVGAGLQPKGRSSKSWPAPQPSSPSGLTIAPEGVKALGLPRSSVSVKFKPTDVFHNKVIPTMQEVAKPSHTGVLNKELMRHGDKTTAAIRDENEDEDKQGKTRQPAPPRQKRYMTPKCFQVLQ